MQLLLGILMLVLMGIVASLLGQFSRAFPLIVAIFWIATIPICFYLKKINAKKKFKKKIFVRIRTTIMIVAVVLSFIIFAHHDAIRDKFGESTIKGYSVYYYEDVDDYGRPTMVADYSTDSFWGTLVLWVFGWIMIILIFAIPIIVWQLTKPIYELVRWDDEEGKCEDDI